MRLAEYADIISGFAAGFGVILIIVGWRFAWLQIKVNREIQAKATATELFRSYQELAFRNPEFADPLVTGFNWEKAKANCRIKYELFVSYMLTACEEIMMIDPSDREWNFTFYSLCKRHKQYLSSSRFQEWESNSYYPNLKQIIDKVIAG